MGMGCANHSGTVWPPQRVGVRCYLRIRGRCRNSFERVCETCVLRLSQSSNRIKTTACMSGRTRWSTTIPTLTTQPHHELKMDNETETRTIRLTSEIIRCIAKSLLASAEELERSLWHYSTPTEHSQSSSDCDDAALKL